MYMCEPSFAQQDRKNPDPVLDSSREIRPQVIEDSILTQVFPNKLRSEVASNIISGAIVDEAGIDICVKKLFLGPTVLHIIISITSLQRTSTKQTCAVRKKRHWCVLHENWKDFMTYV